MSSYKIGLMVPVRGAALQEQAYNVGSTVEVGIVSGGYFRSELRSLELEVRQTALAIGQERGLNTGSHSPTPGSELLPVSEAAEKWFWSAWVPFLQNWHDFYNYYTTGFQSIAPIKPTSRAEQLEDYRAKFIKLRKEASQLYGGAIDLLPAPAPPKKYQGLWDDVLDGIKRLVVIVLGGLTVYYLITTLAGRFHAVPA